jgi:DNA-binding transcriptional regulator WhiA
MSFSSEVKEELVKQHTKSRHCQIAELAAILELEGSVSGQPPRLVLDSDNPLVQKRYALLMKLAFSVEVEKSREGEQIPGAETPHETGQSCEGKASRSAGIALDEETSGRVLAALKWEEGQPKHWRTNGLLVQNTCCRKAFLRGAFLASGSISDPAKSYHFEIVCSSMEQAMQLQKILIDFAADAKIVERKGHYVVYLKEGSQIVDILGSMEAFVSLMNLENVRILKEMRNSVNRKVNCETANISKTVSAAVKQVEDIERIRDTIGIDALPVSLREIAQVRLEYPEAPLKELGTYLDPPVGKSGVNHRLRRLSEIAERL